MQLPGNFDNTVLTAAQVEDSPGPERSLFQDDAAAELDARAAGVVLDKCLCALRVETPDDVQSKQ